MRRHGLRRPPTALSNSTLWGGIWACLLVAALSLTGVGWSLPNSWVKSIGIQVPDYTEARSTAKRLAQLVAKVAAQPYAERGDVEAFLKIAGSLRDEIEKNRSLEPEWAMPAVDCALDDLRDLMEQAATDFLPDKDAPNSRQAVKEFSLACAFETNETHASFEAALRRLSAYWLDWSLVKELTMQTKLILPLAYTPKSCRNIREWKPFGGKNTLGEIVEAQNAWNKVYWQRLIASRHATPASVDKFGVTISAVLHDLSELETPPKWGRLTSRPSRSCSPISMRSSGRAGA